MAYFFFGFGGLLVLTLKPREFLVATAFCGFYGLLFVLLADPFYADPGVAAEKFAGVGAFVGFLAWGFSGCPGKR